MLYCRIYEGGEPHKSRWPAHFPKLIWNVVCVIWNVCAICHLINSSGYFFVCDCWEWAAFPLDNGTDEWQFFGAGIFQFTFSSSQGSWNLSLVIWRTCFWLVWSDCLPFVATWLVVSYSSYSGRQLVSYLRSFISLASKFCRNHQHFPIFLKPVHKSEECRNVLRVSFCCTASGTAKRMTQTLTS